MKKVLFLIVSVLILGLVFAGCGDIFNITLPDGGSNLLPRGVFGGGDLYGIESGTGDFYRVNLETEVATYLFTTSNLVITSVGPNGLAYDELNDRLYYCEYYSDSTAELWFWDGANEVYAGLISAGSSNAGIANADCYDGKYYYIRGYTDDLYEVSFNPNGTIATNSKKADVAGDSHSWTFDGDIAIQDGVVYGWGLCRVHNKYEYFTCNVDGSGFNLIEVTPYYSSSYQLAFGSDDQLYGHSFYNGGFFMINTATGIGTSVFSGGHKFTDCASGSSATMEEVPGIEVVKECPPEFAYVGDTLTYNYTVSNTGNGALLDVTLVDDSLGSITLSGLTDEDGDTFLDDLAEGASATGTADYVVFQGDTVLLNTATATGTSLLGVKVTDDDLCSVSVITCSDETAWAYGGVEVAKPNNEVEGNKSNAWGWTNKFVDEIGFPIDLELWAAAGQNDTSKGILVGTVIVDVDRGCVTVTYKITEDTDYQITEAHLWVGDTALPMVKKGKKEVPTAAPGQFPYSPIIAEDGKSATWGPECSFESSIWIAAHAVIEWCGLPELQ